MYLPNSRTRLQKEKRDANLFAPVRKQANEALEGCVMHPKEKKDENSIKSGQGDL
jgi:hypothetical protein